jgi:hypothetical protein
MITFSLEDSAALTCEDCGYVGIPADHRPEGEESESWDEALGRFREAGEAPANETVALEAGGRTYRLPGELRDRLGELTDSQKRVIEELLAEETPTDPDRTYAAIGDAADASPSYVSSILGDREDLIESIVGTAEER